jgi:ferritin-like metal-binding protein YciE
MPIKSLHDLMVNELKDLYHAEKQITRALPKMAKNAQSDKLKKAFEDHLKVTENQITRLEEIFEELEIPAKGKKCIGMEGIINEGKEIMDEGEQGPTLDAALISAAQKVEHYEIASYGTVRTFAEELGFQKVADLLQKTLDEESQTNELLTSIAESEINFEAIHEEGTEDEE